MFLSSMKKNFGVDRVVMSLLFYENDGCGSWDEAVKFWKSKLGVHVDRVERKNQDLRDDSGKNRNKLTYGVCEVVLYKSACIVQAIYGGIEVIAGGVAQFG